MLICADRMSLSALNRADSSPSPRTPQGLTSCEMPNMSVRHAAHALQGLGGSVPGFDKLGLSSCRIPDEKEVG